MLPNIINIKCMFGNETVWRYSSATKQHPHIYLRSHVLYSTLTCLELNVDFSRSSSMPRYGVMRLVIQTFPGLL